MSQRIQPFFQIRRKELHPFSLNTTQRIEPFFFKMTQRIWPFSLKNYAKNRTILSRNMTQRSEPCVKKKDSKNGTLYMGLIELNLFLWTSSQYDSKSWSLFSVWCEELNLSCFPIWLKELNLFFFQNAQGIEPLFHMNYFFTWLELNSFLINTTQRIFFHEKWLKVLNTFEFDWKSCSFFCIGLKELNFFSTIWLKELSLFL